MIKQLHFSQPFSIPLFQKAFNQRSMTLEEAEPNPTQDHILDWLEDSVSFLPSFLDDPYNPGDINSNQWWGDQSHDFGQDLINIGATATSVNSPIIAAAEDTTNIGLIQSDPTIPDPPLLSNSCKRRKPSDELLPRASQNHQYKRHDSSKINEDGKSGVEEVGANKRSTGNKRNSTKSSGNNCNNSNNKEGRWAEQLLNPCASAITAGNLTRVHHLLYVLNELASSTGDANHRLADHGLRALTHHRSSSSSASTGPVTFASTEPKFFQRSLLKFYEVSPWFAFPNNIANASMLQILAQEPDKTCNLHILDIGVSHGVQWPILLEALSHRSGGPPPLVRITVVAATAENNQIIDIPFSIGPPGHDFYSRLPGFAKSMNINLQINRLENQSLQNLTAQTIGSSPGEILIVCAQFRLHHLNHNTPDQRTEFLRVLKSLDPKGVILSENNMECSCSNCGNFETGFSRRVEYLWKFLDSTSSAFKGRESEERRVMEGEAAKALTNQGEMNEGKEKWCERMRDVGFVGEVLGEDAIDGARALLRKYDSNWEMRVEDKDGCVGLWWKGQPVSFCSLWKVSIKEEES